MPEINLGAHHVNTSTGFLQDYFILYLQKVEPSPTGMIPWLIWPQSLIARHSERCPIVVFNKLGLTSSPYCSTLQTLRCRIFQRSRLFQIIQHSRATKDFDSVYISYEFHKFTAKYLLQIFFMSFILPVSSTRLLVDININMQLLLKTVRDVRLRNEVDSYLSREGVGGWMA